MDLIRIMLFECTMYTSVSKCGINFLLHMWKKCISFHVCLNTGHLLVLHAAYGCVLAGRRSKRRGSADVMTRSCITWSKISRRRCSSRLRWSSGLRGLNRSSMMLWHRMLPVRTSLIEPDSFLWSGHSTGLCVCVCVCVSLLMLSMLVNVMDCNRLGTVFTAVCPIFSLTLRQSRPNKAGPKRLSVRTYVHTFVCQLSSPPFTMGAGNWPQSLKLGRSFVRYCGQGSSLLWTPALRPLCRSNAPPRKRRVIGRCVRCMCVLCRVEEGLSRREQLVRYF